MGFYFNLSSKPLDAFTGKPQITNYNYFLTLKKTSTAWIRKLNLPLSGGAPTPGPLVEHTNVPSLPPPHPPGLRKSALGTRLCLVYPRVYPQSFKKQLPPNEWNLMSHFWKLLSKFQSGIPRNEKGRPKHLYSVGRITYPPIDYAALTTLNLVI